MCHGKDKIQHQTSIDQKPLAHEHSTMQMYFHTGITETILFNQWKTDSLTIFVTSCLVIFIFGILYEGLKELRIDFEERSRQRETSTKTTAANVNQTNELERLNDDQSKTTKTTRNHRINSIDRSLFNFQSSPTLIERLIFSIIYMIQLNLSYLLMLVAMTFNIYLFLSIILGMGVGHFIYSWSRQIFSNEKIDNF